MLALISFLLCGHQAAEEPGSCAGLMQLSVDDLALLTYCVGVAPSPRMGLWTGTKSLPPQMLLSHRILCQFSE